MEFDYSKTKKQLIFGIFLNAFFTIVEFIAGIFANSLALITDSIHDLSDTLALILALVATRKAEKKPDVKRTFGYQRATILAAFINSIFLIVITFFIFIKAYERIINPQEVDGFTIFIVAILGVIINGLIVLKLSKGREDINIKAAFWHMMEDFLGWLGVIVAGIIIIFTDWYIIDPIISIIIGLIILYGVWGIIKDTVNILLEGVPKGLDVNQIKKSIEGIKNVKSVHDIHVWCLNPSSCLLSCHVRVPDMKVGESKETIEQISEMLKEKYKIIHTSIQLECDDCPSDEKCD